MSPWRPESPITDQPSSYAELRIPELPVHCHDPGSDRGSTSFDVARRTAAASTGWRRIMRSHRLGRGVRLVVAVGTALAFACSCTSGGTHGHQRRRSSTASWNGVRPLTATRERHGQDLRHAGRRGAAHRGRATAHRSRNGRPAAGHRPRTDGDARLPRPSRPDRVQPRHAELEPARPRSRRAVRQAALRLPLRHGRHGHDAGDQPGRPEVRGEGRTPSRAEVRAPELRRSPGPRRPPPRPFRAWASTWSTPATPPSCPARTTSRRSSSAARGTAATPSSNR